MAEAQEVATWRRRRSGHPLLRGCKRDKYTHGLHPAQMEALRAVCAALIPSLPVVVEGHQGDDADHGRGSKDVERFYLASAADGNIPDEVAELVTRCVWEAVVLVNVVLCILSTRVGTLALCGRLCMSGKFPYVLKFSDMPVERREEALARWNKARWLFPLKITFVVIKVLSHYAFYMRNKSAPARQPPAKRTGAQTTSQTNRLDIRHIIGTFGRFTKYQVLKFFNVRSLLMECTTCHQYMGL